MTIASLLTSFLSEECNEYVREVLIEEMEKSKGVDVQREFTFNRFNIRLNFADNQAYIEDDLNIDESGEFKLTIDEFLDVLRGAGSG